MPLDTTSHSQTFAPMVMVAIVLLVLVLRNQRARPLRVELLWVRPVLLLAVFGFGALREPIVLTPLNLTVLIAGTVIGAAVGWQRGRFTRIEVDPDTHAVTSRASVFGIVFIVGVLLLRVLAVTAMREQAATLPISPIVGSDALIALVIAMFATQGLEMWIRARGLLAQAQAAKLTSAGNPPIVR
jgi:hypothetical protein